MVNSVSFRDLVLADFDLERDLLDLERVVDFLELVLGDLSRAECSFVYFVDLKGTL